MHIILAFVLTTLLSLPSQAQIFQCSPGVYTDKPCEGGAKVATAQDAKWAGGKLDFQMHLKHYTVHGNSYHQVFANMMQAGPFQGFARWQVLKTYDAKPAGKGCTLENLVITIRGEILMPEWAEKSSAPSADQAYWNESYKGLKLHEDGHIQHGKEFAVLLKERLLGLGVVPCAELDARANQTHSTLYSNLQARDAEYDRRTSHGLRQNNPQ